ncbi:MAG TPA: DUF460 domain-containing protein [Candidatus Bilamarchaeaceae archaeon]|nr:DUF460 domain-containing protein [Candidatus Bilamarchaeaceae archaeon]
MSNDVSPTPFFVRKVGARFNVKVFSPSKSLTLKEKRIIGKNIVDAHVRDAYAAAIKAYRHYANRLRQIEKEKLKHLVISGHAVGKL